MTHVMILHSLNWPIRACHVIIFFHPQNRNPILHLFKLSHLHHGSSRQPPRQPLFRYRPPLQPLEKGDGQAPDWSSSHQRPHLRLTTVSFVIISTHKPLQIASSSSRICCITIFIPRIASRQSKLALMTLMRKPSAKSLHHAIHAASAYMPEQWQQLCEIAMHQQPLTNTKPLQYLIHEKCRAMEAYLHSAT